MIRYVAIGAVVGFLVAYFLLSHSPQDASLPPAEAPAPTVRPAHRDPSQLLKLEQLPESVQRRLPMEPAQAPDTGAR